MKQLSHLIHLVLFSKAIMKNTKLEVERFYRKYMKHCIAPDIDSLKDYLAAAYSLNEKLRKESKHNFFGCEEFITIKGLRNYYDHEAELYNETRIIPTIKTGLLIDGSMFMCLVSTISVESAIKNLRRKDDEASMRSSLNFYGEVVDINICLLNFAIRVYEKVLELNLDIQTSEFLELKASYDDEEENGLPHFISGEIYTHAGSMNHLIEKAFFDVAEY